VVEITLRVDVDDAEALIAAGKRSTARDGPTDWEPAQPSPAADDPGNIIDGPAQAVVDLLMEGLVRCFQPLSHDPDPLVDRSTASPTSPGRRSAGPRPGPLPRRHHRRPLGRAPHRRQGVLRGRGVGQRLLLHRPPRRRAGRRFERAFEGEEPGTSLDGGLTGELTATYDPVGERGQLILTLATGDVDVEAEGGLF
jgi:hypothetical protein